MTDQVVEEEQKVVEDSNIFEEAKPNQENTEATSDQEVKTDPIDVNELFKDKLAAITNEDGVPKYRDLSQQLEAHAHAEKHIKTLEQELKELREKMQEQETMQEALNNISAKKEPEATKSEGIDAESLKGMTLEAIKEYERSKVVEANKKSVSDSLIQKFGDKEKAKKAYVDKAEELGISVDTLVELAAQSPKAVLSYFGASSSSPNPSSIKGSINTQSLKEQPKDTTDYTARYFKTPNPSISKWREAGEGLYS